MKELIDSSKLDNWIRLNKNVLFIGKHGVGKTSAVLNAFNRAEMKFLYFSASTCDPFIDFVGVPRVVEENGKSILKLIRQEHLEDESVEAIFIDEYNRAPKKMKNAVMELIQFKSINGRKYPNLKVVWAAINPEDDQDTYDVEPLDPAQKDRFHVWVDVEYRPCGIFLEQKYGEKVATSALEWWNKLTDDMKEMVSPRRLCYALDHWLDQGDIREILPANTNVGRLIELLNAEPVEFILQNLFDEKDEYKTQSWINIDNNFALANQYILDNSAYLEYFTRYVNNERLANLISTETGYFNHVMAYFMKETKYANLCHYILQANPHSDVSSKIKVEYIKNNYFDEDIHALIYGQVNREAKFYSNESSKPIEGNFIAIKNDYDLSNLTQSSKDKIWQKLLTNVPKSMTLDQALEFAVFIEIVADVTRSKLRASERYYYFVEVTNTVCKTLFEHGYNHAQIKSILPITFRSLAFTAENNCFIFPR